MKGNVLIKKHLKAWKQTDNNLIPFK
jgi:hypothetical protein